MQMNTVAGSVVTLRSAEAGTTPMHEIKTHEEVGRRLARLRGSSFEGEFDPSRAYRMPMYFVLCDTLVGSKAASDLGIAGERDIYGGIVPHAFVATKAITHPLVDSKAAAPHGWSADFAEQVRGVVPAGLTAFDPDDAMRAARILLARGPVRCKPATSTGGHGQRVIRDIAAIEQHLAALDAAEIRRHGLVVEEQVENARTWSVGQVMLDDLTVSYFGIQTTTNNNDGRPAYGGSSLVFHRGRMASLRGPDIPREMATPITQALRYDDLAFRCYAGLLASRRNYDVIAGTDARGAVSGGVLEQSWRVGGATPAEIAALEAFRAAPERRVVRASSVERYGTDIVIPADAVVYFHGCDNRLGPMVKYARIEP
jgi:hypothetical protein